MNTYSCVLENDLFLGFRDDDGNLEGVSWVHVLAGHLHVSLLFKGIGCVGEKLSDEYLLVLVEGFCHDLQQSLGFGFELKVLDLVLLEVQLWRIREYLGTLGVLGWLFGGKGETGDNGI